MLSVKENRNNIRVKQQDIHRLLEARPGFHSERFCYKSVQTSVNLHRSSLLPTSFGF
jgi:hypothetical protein